MAHLSSRIDSCFLSVVGTIKNVRRAAVNADASLPWNLDWVGCKSCAARRYKSMRPCVHNLKQTVRSWTTSGMSTSKCFFGNGNCNTARRSCWNALGFAAMDWRSLRSR
ncbi:hypothetical protein H310_13535 [Aphanomyces invadans]|uniref:Uncharacterized protein n=1 Tax=Aphanomyces invadans TaxID=157072 RepID=A0A024TDE1_9STRA|nr:hypothetical protein H310_13535 [Aphanomyces invadans]ETV92009.1 hypothetical protein H310_13535 [Aphanomyces invadans]|eukprot:XP_008879306.1 hypothetical protein H310_13535 [Aphanomyces invadans]